jgi:DNA-binding protein HU-beta
MTKAELIERVYHSRGRELTKKQVTELIDGVFEELADYFTKARTTRGAKPKFTYPGFGTFTKKRRKARKGRNPKTGDPMKIPASVSVTFAPGQEFKNRLNRKKR